MIRFIICLFLLVLPATVFAEDPSNQTIIEEVVHPKAPPPSDWVFVIDASDSMEGIFRRAIDGLRYITQWPTDEWHFKVYVFSDKAKTRWTEWEDVSVEALDTVEKWVDEDAQHGVNSYAERAIVKAIQEPRKNLFVILVTDGGFTSSCDDMGYGTITTAIAGAIKARLLAGFNSPLICTIGISNPHYSAWCYRCIHRGSSVPHDFGLPDETTSNKGKKLPNKQCMSYLQWLGDYYRGGFIKIHGAVPDRPLLRRIEGYRR